MKINSSTEIIYTMEGLSANDMRLIRSGLNRLRVTTYPRAREIVHLINAAMRENKGPLPEEEEPEEDEDD